MMFDKTKCLYLFDLTTFKIFGQKFLQFFCCIFGKTPKFYSEINQPLDPEKMFLIWIIVVRELEYFVANAVIMTHIHVSEL